MRCALWVRRKSVVKRKSSRQITSGTSSRSSPSFPNQPQFDIKHKAVHIRKSEE